MEWLIEILIFLFIICILIYVNELKIKNKNNKKLDLNGIPEQAFKNYAQFWGYNIDNDINYQKKMEVIYHLIINKNQQNIKKIATKSKCSYDECIIKIKYLKHKKLINNYCIDNSTAKLIDSSFEDKKILEKYNKYLEQKNLQINQLAAVVPNSFATNTQEATEQVFNDLVYLEQKNLLDDIRIDKLNRYIYYYSEEIFNEENIQQPNFQNINIQNNISN